MELLRPKFETLKEELNWIVENKFQIIEAKKYSQKNSEPISVVLPAEKKNIQEDKSDVKSAIKQGEDNKSVVVKAIINTTNIMDSHDDVHLKGIWTNHLKTFPRLLHLQEHQMAFDKIIAEGEDLKAYVKEYTWKSLGYDYKGTTQALVFESNVKEERNPFMFRQYSNKYVKNHSVGMTYVHIELAVNDPDYEKEYENWNKYIDQVANREYAESKGYFFAVLEARVIEGSAVPIGSNYATPTLEGSKSLIEESEETQEPAPITDEKTIEEEVVPDEIEAKETNPLLNEDYLNERKMFNSDYATYIKIKYKIK
jgi:hypothetical protein